MKHDSKAKNASKQASPRTVRVHRNCLAQVAKILVEEVKILLAEGIDSKKLISHPDDSARRIISTLSNTDMVPLFIDQGALAKRIGYAERNVFEAMNTLVALKVIRRYERNIYVVGYCSPDRDAFIPLEKVLSAVVHVRPQQKKNAHSRCYQTLLRLAIFQNLLAGATETDSLPGERIEEYLKEIERSLEALGSYKSKPAKPAKWETLIRTVDQQFERLAENKDVRNVFIRNRNLKISFFSSLILPNWRRRKKDIFKMIQSDENIPKAKGIKEIRQSISFRPRSPLDQMLRLIEDTRAMVFNRRSRDYLDVENAPAHLIRAARLVDDLARAHKIEHRLLLLNTFGQYKLFRSKVWHQAPPRNWIGGGDFIDYLNRAADALIELKNRAETDPNGFERFHGFADLARRCFKRYGLDPLSAGSEYLTEYNRWCLLRAYDRYRKVKDEFELRTERELTARDFIEAHIDELYGNYKSIQETGKLFLEYMSEPNAGERACMYVVTRDGDYPTLISRERRQELERQESERKGQEKLAKMTPARREKYLDEKQLEEARRKFHEAREKKREQEREQREEQERFERQKSAYQNYLEEKARQDRQDRE